MAKYKVQWEKLQLVEVVVEADNEEDAREKAIDFEDDVTCVETLDHDNQMTFERL
jgi:hypothetical protein